MLRFLSIILLCFPFIARSQFNYEITQTIPVSDINGRALKMPWAGGLNAAQYNTFDLNADGKEDLILFDRMANKVITFINTGDDYSYAPEYESVFPQGITNWLLLRDFNLDGKKDIFTGDVLGIKVFMNTSNDQGMSWSQYLFYNGAPTKSNVLLTKGFSGLINLQIQYDDLPSIIDADGDGDLDIFNIRYQGSTLEYHQNFSKERYGKYDSLDFERITNYWGNVRECGCGTFTFDGSLCPTSGREKHAGGKTLLIMDTDGDQQLDILISESACSNLYLLKNEGTTNAPVFNSAVKFPESKPAEFPLFPAPFYEDVDFDGIKDLIVTPNIYSKESNLTDLQNSNWLYKNSASNAAPSFNFIYKNFLQHEMIDVGDNAIPAFADVDGDGDQDMFISRNAAAGSAATIFLYENTGTPADPSFRLKTEDYLEFSIRGFINLKIHFVDINHNGTKDLVFTGSKDLATQMHFINNKNINNLDFSGQSIENTNLTLSTDENISLSDINDDGFPDVLIGKADGSLEYRKHTQSTTPSFALENPAFLNLGQSVSRLNITTATGDLNNDGNADLIIGGQVGQLSIISNFKNVSDATDAKTEIIYNSRTENYETQNLGGKVWPSIVNLYNTDYPVIVSGNILGGLQVIKHSNQGNAGSEFIYDVYPNPVNKAESLNIRVNQPCSVQIIAINGKSISSPLLLESKKINVFSVSSLAAGLYILKFTTKNNSYATRLVVR